MGEAIDEMKKHVLISSREDMAYRVSFDAAGRELAQRGLELLVNGVVDEDAQRRIHEADETKRFLDVERKHADDDLKTKESALAGFLAAHPRLRARGGGDGGVGRRRDPRAPSRARRTSSSSEVAQLELQAAQIEEALAAAGVHVAAGSGPVDAPPAGRRARAGARRAAAGAARADREAGDVHQRAPRREGGYPARRRRRGGAPSRRGGGGSRPRGTAGRQRRPPAAARTTARTPRGPRR